MAHLVGVRRVMAVASGLLGAELVGVAGFALGAGMIATNWPPTALAGAVLLPVLMAGAGPVGYDMAQSWVPDLDCSSGSLRASSPQFVEAENGHRG